MAPCEWASRTTGGHACLQVATCGHTQHFREYKPLLGVWRTLPGRLQDNVDHVSPFEPWLALLNTLTLHPSQHLACDHLGSLLREPGVLGALGTLGTLEILVPGSLHRA